MVAILFTFEFPYFHFTSLFIYFFIYFALLLFNLSTFRCFIVCQELQQQIGSLIIGFG